LQEINSKLTLFLGYESSEKYLTLQCLFGTQELKKKMNVFPNLKKKKKNAYVLKLFC